jgi:ribonuclease III
MCDNAKEPAQSRDPLGELESRLGYTFKERSSLVTALTHRSYAHQLSDHSELHNESLEFLGDAVLGFLISSRIFRRFPDLNEGDLSKIRAYMVSAVNLTRFAESLELGAHLRISRGEEKTGGRKKRALLVDAFEAVIGAIYMDGGVDAAAAFVERQMGAHLDSLDPGQLTYGDFKSALQEKLHDLGLPEPQYRVVHEIGPDHLKTFVVQVLVGGETVSEASGRTKKEAQQAAARLAVEHFSSSPGAKDSSDADTPPASG